MSAVHETLAAVTERIRSRSARTRSEYLARLDAARQQGPIRHKLACSNLAHAFAAAEPSDKEDLKSTAKPNIAIISSFNDMLSAHQPFERFPDIIKRAAREANAVAQVAGCVPAMCDGVTQGQPGMELSLFSRDVIAMSTAVSLAHNMFDAALYLGVCDKIVPGLLIGALHFGHLPAIFVPAGPMPTGLSHEEKGQIRRLHAQGKVDASALLESESQCFHAAGTCTFFGTANSNQMLMEIMGLHLPGSAFINPGTPLRDALTAEAARRVTKLLASGDRYTPVGHVINERSLVNGIVGLLATGGSTNHTIHLVAIGRAAGISLTWDDFSDLSAVVPTIAKIYPSGKADINQFQAAGGMGLVIRELRMRGLLHVDVPTVGGAGGLLEYENEPYLDDGTLRWRPAPEASLDATVIASGEAPFAPDGGLKLLRGNLGRAVIKTSSLKPEHRIVRAPAVVFHDQNEFHSAFIRGELNKNFVAVVQYQGPRACGMPELHKLTPALEVLQAQGFTVGLVTDGRMSGASGRIPAAIHVTPECVSGGMLGKVRTGDVITLDSEHGTIAVEVSDAELAAREEARPDLDRRHIGLGRELFESFRDNTSSAEKGATSFDRLDY